LATDDLETNTVVNRGLRTVAALGQIVKTVGPVYILPKKPSYCTMPNLNLPSQYPNSSRRRRIDNIKIDLQVVGCGSTDWIDLARDREK